MPHIVTDKCSGCKFTDCVEVCPVACFYELENQVVIHPEDCIDCMACVDVCPVHAIYAEADLPSEFTKDVEFNAVQSRQLKDSGAEAITIRKDPLPTVIFGECHDVADGVFAADQHHQAIESKGDSAMRWRAQAKGAQQMAELCLLIFRTYSQRFEHFGLQLRLVNADAAAANLNSV